MTVNGVKAWLRNLSDLQTRVLNVEQAMLPGNQNVITLRAVGPGSASVLISDGAPPDSSEGEEEPRCDALLSAGGYIESAGACAFSPRCAEAAGRAMVAVLSSQRAGNAPRGVFVLRFAQGRFNFTSTRFDRLIVDGGRATLQGSGEVNRAGDFGFLLELTKDEWAGTRLAITIWDRSQNDAVVYQVDEPFRHGWTRSHCAPEHGGSGRGGDDDDDDDDDGDDEDDDDHHRGGRDDYYGRDDD